MRYYVIKNAVSLALSYLKHPYHLSRNNEFDDFNHEHTCLLARVAPFDFRAQCPMASMDHRIIPGRRDECEFCQYFGTMNYRREPKSGSEYIFVELDNRFASTHEPIVVKKPEKE